MVSRTYGRGRPINAPAAFIIRANQLSPSSPQLDRQVHWEGYRHPSDNKE